LFGGGVRFPKDKSRLAPYLFANHLTEEINFSFCQQRISHLVGLLSDGGKPVLLVGEAGCGKTSILRHRLKQHGGDIGEVLSLTVFCNKFTTSRSLWKEMSSCLEWKHARTFVPKGNKRLTCLVDDLNLSRVSVDIVLCHPFKKKREFEANAISWLLVGSLLGTKTIRSHILPSNVPTSECEVRVAPDVFSFLK